LAVDDVQENLEILNEILKDIYTVITVDSGAKALEVMKTGEKPDLILLDLSMPEMDGFELLEKIREDEANQGIPAIFVTGTNDVYSEGKGLMLGAVDYIKKPYEPNIIRVKIRNHIELKMFRDDLSEAVNERTRQLEERTAELIATHSAIIMGMSLLSESRDKVTGSHLLRIQSLARIIADKISSQYPAILDENMVDQIVTYSPLHDIGKVAVPDAVLTKKEKLTWEEFEQMKHHAKGGGELLRQINEFLPHERNHLDIAIEIAECHHERFNGTGYPDKLAGEDIPLSARIVAIADVYDALRSPRPYKKGFSHQEACDIILKGDGRTEPTHFDPLVLKAFEDSHQEMCKAYDSNPDPSVF
jgi:putative two-component system response regulator